jgi:hypothetical protein
MARRSRFAICLEISDDALSKQRRSCGLRQRKARPLFPPVKNQQMRHGVAIRSVLSCNGRVELRRRRFRDAAGQSEVPVDDLIDLASSGVSLAVREMCCRIATDSGSFARAAANLNRLAQVQLSDEKLRQLAQSDGRAVLAWHEQEQLEFDFDAGKCLTDQTGDGSIRSRIYVGIDGFMVPMVTDAEAGKRHKKAVARRKRLKRKKGVRRQKLKRRQGADQRYKEIKLMTIYDQYKSHRLVRATRLGVKQAGRLLRDMSADVKLKSADQVAAVTDGAEWIARLIDVNLPTKTTVILDYFHASQHVHQARRTLFGEDNADGDRWSENVLETLSKGKWTDLWELLLQERSRLRSKTKRKAADDLMSYLLERREKVDYASFRAAGYDIGSGPTESMCKSLSRRMKGIGMRWTGVNAEAMIALESLHQSDLWPNYWKTRLAA